MDSEEITRLSREAKKLIKNVDDDIKSDTFQVVFRKLIDEYRIEPKSRKSVTSGNVPNEKISTKQGPKSHLKELQIEGFFKKPKNMKNILDELKIRTFYYKPQDLTLPLRTLVRDKTLRRIEQKNDKNKNMLHWVNW